MKKVKIKKLSKFFLSFSNSWFQLPNLNSEAKFYLSGLVVGFSVGPKTVVRRRRVVVFDVGVVVVVVLDDFRRLLDDLHGGRRFVVAVLVDGRNSIHLVVRHFRIRERETFIFLLRNFFLPSGISVRRRHALL